jgi:hypothetical protein
MARQTQENFTSVLMWNLKLSQQCLHTYLEAASTRGVFQYSILLLEDNREITRDHLLLCLAAIFQIQSQSRRDYCQLVGSECSLPAVSCHLVLPSLAPALGMIGTAISKRRLGFGSGSVPVVILLYFTSDDVDYHSYSSIPIPSLAFRRNCEWK